ncbi:MAG: ABC-2 transporter permease [Peptostreptococcaceae bacterium]|nr:ABC-2 transporter permease [Peptostreptococcaceae bacterium]
MKGLLWKELLAQKAAGLYVFLVLIVIAIPLTMVGQSPDRTFVTNGTILLILMITQSFGYDYTSKWELFATSMPLKKSSFVLVKYLFAFLGTLVIAVFLVLPALLIKKADREIMLMVFFGYICFIQVFIGIGSAVNFVFGVQRGYYVMVLLIGAIVGGSVLIFKEESNRSLLANYIAKFSIEMLLLQIVLLSAILVGLSMLISIRSFAKKDL